TAPRRSRRACRKKTRDLAGSNASAACTNSAASPISRSEGAKVALLGRAGTGGAPRGESLQFVPPLPRRATSRREAENEPGSPARERRDRRFQASERVWA